MAAISVSDAATYEGARDLADKVRQRLDGYGGTTGSVAPMPALRPLEKAFKQSLPAMKSILDVEMRKALTNALRAQERRNKADGK